MKKMTAKKAREQITCTGQDQGDILFGKTVIGRMSTTTDGKGKISYQTIICINGEMDDDSVPQVLKAPKRNALLDKVAKLASTSISEGTWPFELG